MKFLLLAALIALTTSAHANTLPAPKWEIVVTESEDRDHPKTYPFSGEAQVVNVGTKNWSCKANKSAGDPLEFGVYCAHTSGAMVALAVGCNDSAHPGELGIGTVDSKAGSSISIRCNSGKPSAAPKAPKK